LDETERADRKQIKQGQGMTGIKNPNRFAEWLRHATPNSPLLYRLNIHRRLALCFIFVITLMLVGNGIILWQLHLIRAQVERLNGVDEVLIEVLRVHSNLLSAYERLDFTAHSQDYASLQKESESLQAGLLEDAQRTQAVFNHLPGEAKVDQNVLPTLESIERTMPPYLEAIRVLAAAGEWEAVRVRIGREVHPLESLSSELVNDVVQQVGEERAEAALNIARAERRMFLAIPITGIFTLLIAAGLGVAITRSITVPLGRLVEGSKALAQGEFQHQVLVVGEDELAHLSRVFNETTGKLRDLYDALRMREEKLRQQEAELRQLIDLALQHVAVLGADGSHLYLNQAGLEYHGLTLEEWRSCDLRTRFHPDDWERMTGGIQTRFASGSAHEIEARLKGKDGKYRWFLFRRNPLLDEQGRVVRWYSAATDIDDRKQAEERVQNEILALREEIDRSSMFEEIVGSSEALRRVLSQVTKVAPSDSTVLILGETGTGKELIARAIHKRSKRSTGAFIRVNCAAIHPSLLASELFGHERGSFTGAFQRRLGRFESANGGTIFLDEIGDLPAETQVALLRVLQEREFERVGNSQPISVDVRVLAATNRDLKAAVAAGTFRADLFYRLNVFPIQVPSLRERADDIPLLVEYLIERYAKKAGKNIRNIEKRTLSLFQEYPWPGNIRELQNVIERAVILSEGESFSVDEARLTCEMRRESAELSVPARSLLRLDDNQERELIEAALAECGGRVSGPSGAASKLGIPRQTLESKIINLGINKHRFKTA
jgi:PAS domain S-box-containing protein